MFPLVIQNFTLVFYWNSFCEGFQREFLYDYRRHTEPFYSIHTLHTYVSSRPCQLFFVIPVPESTT